MIPFDAAEFRWRSNMKSYVHKIVPGILLALLPAFCGLIGSRGLSAVLSQADTVVVATINTSNAISTDSAVTVNLKVQRVLKGSMSVLTTFTAQWPHNPIPVHVMSGFGVTGNGSGAFPPGRAGIWFLQQYSSTWRIVPPVEGDGPLDYLYIPLPSTELPAAYAYDATVDPKKKLLSELEAAAVDSKTSDMITRMALLEIG